MGAKAQTEGAGRGAWPIAFTSGYRWRSALDAVLVPPKALQSKVSAPDHERWVQYFWAVRDLEQRLVGNQEWALKPKRALKVVEPSSIVDRNDPSLHQR
ncbi:MAG: hypothetical protein SGI77_10785 [Pirellulaceae bacterium]|nr:hypothetical protein [Pirellulaceae bacterium]